MKISFEIYGTFWFYIGKHKNYIYEELDEFIKWLENNDILDEIKSIWTGNDNSLKKVNKQGLTGKMAIL